MPKPGFGASEANVFSLSHTCSLPEQVILENKHRSAYPPVAICLLSRAAEHVKILTRLASPRSGLGMLEDLKLNYHLCLFILELFNFYEL